jgi:hypothetical protein
VAVSGSLYSHPDWVSMSPRSAKFLLKDPRLSNSTKLTIYHNLVQRSKVSAHISPFLPTTLIAWCLCRVITLPCTLPILLEDMTLFFSCDVILVNMLSWGRFIFVAFEYDVRCLNRGTRLSSWLRHYATSWKIAVSIPYEVIAFLN